MFSLRHSPLTSGLLSKFTNTPSGGVQVVKTHLVFVGQPIHALPRMLGESEKHCEPKPSSAADSHHDEWQDVPSEARELASSFAVRRLKKAVKKHQAHYKHGKK
jgi:hypothetical protein